MIHKRSINLILRKEHTAPVLLRAKHIARRVATVSLVVFCFAALFTMVYLRIQYDRFNALKQEVQNLENRISERKTIEGMAAIAQEKLAVLERLNSINRSYSRLLSETLALQTPSVIIASIVVSKDRNMSLSVISRTSEALEEFVDGLIRGDAKGQFVDISATGILRDRDGGYSLTVSMRPDATLFQKL